MTTTTTTTIRRGDLAYAPDGALVRVVSLRGGFAFTDRGTYAPDQLTTSAPDPVAAARAFLAAQTTAMQSWTAGALPSRKDHETALGHIAALLGVVE